MSLAAPFSGLTVEIQPIKTSKFGDGLLLLYWHYDGLTHENGTLSGISG